jgi:hypothetical protein
MKQGQHVLISRVFRQPTINIGISKDRIAIDIPLDDFLAAVAEQYGNPATTLTKAQHLTRLATAATVVVDSMKAETTRVV